ncbi:MAG: hypothetical protein SNJ74_01460 [Fimbriimonadaceae bacterium]
MKSNSVLRSVIASACALAAVGTLIGCQTGPAPSAKVEEQRLASAIELRSFFDKVNGDYSQLSEADRAEFERLTGGPEEAQRAWNLMKFGPGAVNMGLESPPTPK